jgi:lipoprotein-anchoring transpeptidase ErfK/SrfK
MQPATEQPDQTAPDQSAKIAHHGTINRFASVSQLFWVCGRDTGTATIREKREWPDWYPPREMVQRQPELRRQLTELQSGIGMAGGPLNPLGSRALYLWQGNKDTLFRIHGTVEPWTIGRSVSSGCIRMIDQDVIDLYQRTPIGAKVVVLGHAGAEEFR